MVDIPYGCGGNGDYMTLEIDIYSTSRFAYDHNQNYE